MGWTMTDITGKTLDDLEADGYFDRLEPKAGDIIVTMAGRKAVILSIDSNVATVKFMWELLTWRQKLKAFLRGSW